MGSNLVTKVRGFVTIELKGERLEELINLASASRLILWDMRIKAPQLAEVNLHVSDVFKLRPFLKQTGCRMHILRRYGLPFFLDKLGKRKFFMIGAVLFLIGLFLLSSLVWKVEVEGNEKLLKAEVLEEAQKIGIYELQWKFRLADADRLAMELQSRLPGTAWVGVELEGTHVRIKVVESTSPDPKELVSPRHLVASKNAVITGVFAEKGKPVVQPNQYVRKGDVLISGWIGNEENSQLVVSSGKVMGLVWYTSKIDIPLVRQYKTYTGESYNRFSLLFGNRALPLNQWTNQGYEEQENIASRKTIRWRDYRLPFGWMTERVMEVKKVEQPLPVEDAEQIALERARSELLIEAGEGSRIVSEKLLNRKEEGGKLFLEVHFEVEEEISEELAIVPGY